MTWSLRKQQHEAGSGDESLMEVITLSTQVKDRWKLMTIMIKHSLKPLHRILVVYVIFFYQLLLSQIIDEFNFKIH